MSTSTKMDRTAAWVTLRHGTLGLIMLNRHWRSRYARGDESPMTLCGGVTMRERLSAWPERLAVALLAGVLTGALFWPLQCVTLAADVRRSPGGGAERPSQTEDAVRRVSPDITPQPVHSTSYCAPSACELQQHSGERTSRTARAVHCHSRRHSNVVDNVRVVACHSEARESFRP
jgi:hypothetical protein